MQSTPFKYTGFEEWAYNIVKEKDNSQWTSVMKETPIPVINSFSPTAGPSAAIENAVGTSSNVTPAGPTSIASNTTDTISNAATSTASSGFVATAAALLTMRCLLWRVR